MLHLDGSHTKPRVEIPLPLKDAAHKVIGREREEEKKETIIMCTRWWITRMLSLSRQQQYVQRISLTNDGDANGLQKSTGNLTLIIPHFWFTFESLFDCIRWLLYPKKKGKERGKKKKKQGQNTFRLNLKVPLSLRLPCTSIYRLIIQSENENWSLKHLYLNKEREADYECSKCNFYYTSIILLLITDSFSLCSSSKTRLYSIHVHTGAKEKLARLFEMFNLGGGGGGDTAFCWKDMCCRNWSIRFNHNLWNHFNSVCNYSSHMRIIPLSLSLSLSHF